MGIHIPSDDGILRGSIDNIASPQWRWSGERCPLSPPTRSNNRPAFELSSGEIYQPKWSPACFAFSASGTSAFFGSLPDRVGYLVYNRLLTRIQITATMRSCCFLCGFGWCDIGVLETVPLPRRFCWGWRIGHKFVFGLEVNKSWEILDKKTTEERNNGNRSALSLRLGHWNRRQLWQLG